MYNVTFVSKRVLKEFEGLTNKDRESVSKGLEILRLDPRPVSLCYGKVGSSSFVKRVKIGRVRIFYRILENTIQIGKIELRNSTTYGFCPENWFGKIA